MSHRIPSAALLLCTLAACGQSPTGSDAHARPAGPSYDGGYTMGSGNATQSGGFTIGSGNTEDASSSGTTESGETTTERGGYTMGSGN
ncbi:MAG TPA: hypothetical protein VGC13_13870 [Longimicrobium sp.]|uniref:hypothetical protein n=1 Tax=Longimicrobium sp. TaxID=2029185 RepID=UPI002EDB1AFC